MSKENGGQAFPGMVCVGHVGEQPIYEHPHGMTLRDYFAAKAMAAMISTAAIPCLGGLDGGEIRTAWAAYKMADEMLARRDLTK